MEKQTFREIELKSLVPNPMNPRRRIDGPKFEELVKSVRSHGVIEPILARPKGKNKLEIVVGERRWRAAVRVAEGNGGPTGKTIPAIVRELSDDDAFEIMCIENLQREDLTELEEAESFKVYLDKKGDGAMAELAERTGINETYIRRRVAVLGLPKKTLKAWEKGEIRYGHLEQMCRLKDKKEIGEYRQEIIQQRGGYSVRNMKSDIDSEAPALKDGRFDLEKAGCLVCNQNTEVQKKLFDYDGMEGAHCVDPKCFKRNQNNWLQANWSKTGYRRQHRTNGFRFRADIGWNEYASFYSRKPPKRCKECQHFVTLLDLDGRVNEGKACIGDKACFNRKTETKTEGKDKGKTEKRQPPTWHGEYFREEFYKEQLPLKLHELEVDDVVTVRLMLYSLLKSNNGLHYWFDIKRCGGKPRKDDGELYYHRLSWEKIWETISIMDYERAREDLKEASILVVMQDSYAAKCRRMIADHVGISLKDEWRITEEYLKKKIKGEMFEIAKKFKLFKDQKAKTFLYETLLKKRENFNSCKKGELIRLFLESGIDLAGVVPEEILKD